MPVTPVSPEALALDAIACVSPVTDAAVMSPLKIESDVTCAVAPARACTPLVAETLVVTPVAETIEPSDGYENGSSKKTASGGAAEIRVVTSGWPGTTMRIAQARAVAPAERSAEPCDAPSASRAASAASAGRVLRTGLLQYSRPGRRLLLVLQALAREGEEALAGGVVRPERLVVRVLRVVRDLLGDRPHLAGQRLVVGRVAEERLDPALRAVVVGEVVVEEQLPEQEAGADVRERAEREDPVRRVDELRDLRVLVLDLLDDRADRLVDERDPEVVEVGHPRDYGCLRRERQAIWAAVSSISTANSLRSVDSGSDSATCAPPIAAPTE